MFASDQLKEGKKYDVDFNQQFIETELYDAKPTYKKFSSYRPGVKERNVSSMITYMGMIQRIVSSRIVG
jgi:hypothetical protein